MSDSYIELPLDHVRKFTYVIPEILMQVIEEALKNVRSEPIRQGAFEYNPEDYRHASWGHFSTYYVDFLGQPQEPENPHMIKYHLDQLLAAQRIAGYSWLPSLNFIQITNLELTRRLSLQFVYRLNMGIGESFYLGMMVLESLTCKAPGCEVAATWGGYCYDHFYNSGRLTL